MIHHFRGFHGHHSIVLCYSLIVIYGTFLKLDCRPFKLYSQPEPSNSRRNKLLAPIMRRLYKTRQQPIQYAALYVLILACTIVSTKMSFC